VVVTGESWNGSSWNYCTVKYAAANGSPVWIRNYNGIGNGTDQPRAVAISSTGDVIVTGSSWTGTESNYYTVKYAAGNGATLWQQHGPTGSGQAVAVDSLDNVVVSGHAINGAGYDYYTAKYAAANGALLWEKRYNGPANHDDLISSSHCLAIARNGAVAVTGSSAVYFQAFDYATVVYWETLPAVSIELIGDGVRIRFIGIAGVTYEVQRSASLAGPWNTIASKVAPSGGLIEYIDPKPSTGPNFYRVATP
jgi:hypothetical protein